MNCHYLIEDEGFNVNTKLKELLRECHLDHIAISVENLEQSVKIYEALGLSFDDKREVVEEQAVTTAFAHVDERAHIELLEPYGEDGPIHQSIKKRGPGLHHLCFRVKDVEAKASELKQNGFKLLYEKAKVGAGNCLVNFIHPKSTGGVLVEISQKIEGHK
tara:strand:- start:46221 stop:46703 length:483 start_codon:yes stop_codon:yes gene_type:complete